MPLRKVPNTEDNEKMDPRFDLSVKDSESHYQLHYDYCVICAYSLASPVFEALDDIRNMWIVF